MIDPLAVQALQLQEEKDVTRVDPSVVAADHGDLPRSPLPDGSRPDDDAITTIRWGRLRELFDAEASTLKQAADGAWCINCFRVFAHEQVRYWFGAHDVGPFCADCDELIKLHTHFREARA